MTYIDQIQMSFHLKSTLKSACLPFTISVLEWTSISPACDRSVEGGAAASAPTTPKGLNTAGTEGKTVADAAQIQVRAG